MGSGVNLMFHIGSAVALVLLVHLALEFKRQRDLIRELLGSRARIYVEAPAAFLHRLGKALGIEVEGEAGKELRPRRINPQPLMELFLSGGIDVLKWTGDTLEIRSRAAPGAHNDWQKKLAGALGDGVSIKITGDGT